MTTDKLKEAIAIVTMGKPPETEWGHALAVIIEAALKAEKELRNE